MGYVVTYDTLFAEEGNLEDRASETVDPKFVRPLAPKTKNVGNDDDEFKVMDVVDCYHRDGWWRGVVENVTVVDVESGGQKKKYLVKFENPVEDFEFLNTQMRPHFDWVDSSWKLAPNKTQEQGVADKDAIPTSESNNLARQTVVHRRSSTKKKHLRKKPESNSDMGVVDGLVTTSRKRSTMNLSEVSSSKKTRSLADVENSGDQEASTRSSSASEDLTTDVENQPLSVWYQGVRHKAGLKRSSCRDSCDHLDESSDALIPAAIAENSGATDNHITWPFMKRSPMWAAIESHELYQKSPQKPHFAPLKNVREDCREGLAIAHMVTYANVTQTMLDLQLNDPINIIVNSLYTLAELETHGFNVGAMQARLNELRVWKLKVSQLEEKVKLYEKDVEKLNGEKPILEEKIKDLQEKLSKNVAMKKMNDDEIKRLQSNKLLAKNQIKEWELAFQKLAASRL